MARIFKKTSSIKLPERNRASKNEEFWRERKGVTKCPTCGNVHFRKRWFGSIDDLKNKFADKNIPIARIKLCPACNMIKDHLFYGEVFFDNIPLKHRKELTSLVRNFAERATSIDPQDRLIKIEGVRGGFRATTTVNQLAVKHAKKIKDAFNNVHIHISYSKEPSLVDRVHAVFEVAK